MSATIDKTVSRDRVVRTVRRWLLRSRAMPIVRVMPVVLPTKSLTFNPSRECHRTSAFQSSRRDHCGGSDPRAAPAAKKGGRSLHQHPSRAAPGRAGREGAREAQPRIASLHRTREIRVVPRLMRRFG